MEKNIPGQDISMNDDPVPMFMRRYFEYSLTYCVKFVHDVDLQRYEDFKAI